jgi:hypothetical protein
LPDADHDSTTHAMPEPKPIPGYQATTCPRCGAAFACGAEAARETPCSCAAIALSPQRRAELRVRYAGCLCAACLAMLAREPASQA